MRQIVSITLVVMIVCLVGFGVTVALDPSKTYEFFASLSGSETLDKRSTEPFVPPKGSFRVYFPAKKPGQMTEANSFLRQTPLPCPQYYVGDRDVAYFATEFPADLSIIAAANNHPNQPALRSVEDTALAFAGAQTGVTQSASTNNDIVATSPAIDPLAVQNFLDTKCGDLIDKTNGTISSKVPAAIGGGAFPGRYVEGVFKNTKNAFRMRLFLNQHTSRFVCLAVVGKTKRVYSKPATKFLDSLDMWSR